MKILITAIGKRVQLIKYLKRDFIVIGVDAGELAPAINFVDKFYIVPRYYENNYIDKIIEICEKEKINMVIPLYEKEFLLFDGYRKEFEKLNTILLLSGEEIINVCNNKINTYNFFKDNGINTPRVYSRDNICDNLKYPVIIKPIDGMGSFNIFKAKNKYELDFFKNYVENSIIQEYVEGVEYTIDVLCDLQGNVISIVPRERIEIRSGEVSKSRTVNKKNIIEATLHLCLRLKNVSLEKKQTSLIGPITIQCIVDNNSIIKFIEINPRFGGGVPLSFEAGVNYGEFFKNMINGKNIKSILGQYKELTMLRYDEAIFQ